MQGSTSLFGSFACTANSWKGCTGQELSRNALEDRTPKRSDSGTRCRHCQWGAGLWLAARSTSFRSLVLGETGLTTPAKDNNGRVQKPPIHALYTYPCSQCLRYPSFSNSISEYSFSDHSARSPSVQCPLLGHSRTALPSSATESSPTCHMTRLGIHHINLHNTRQIALV